MNDLETTYNSLLQHRKELLALYDQLAESISHTGLLEAYVDVQGHVTDVTGDAIVLREDLEAKIKEIDNLLYFLQEVCKGGAV